MRELLVTDSSEQAVLSDRPFHFCLELYSYTLGTIFSVFMIETNISQVASMLPLLLKSSFTYERCYYNICNLVA